MSATWNSECTHSRHQANLELLPTHHGPHQSNGPWAPLLCSGTLCPSVRVPSFLAIASGSHAVRWCSHQLVGSRHIFGRAIHYYYSARHLFLKLAMPAPMLVHWVTRYSCQGTGAVCSRQDQGVCPVTTRLRYHNVKSSGELSLLLRLLKL